MPDLDEMYSRLEPVSDPQKIHMLCHTLQRAANLWGLEEQDAAQLFGMAEEAWAKVRSGLEPSTFSREQMVRASCVIGIFRCLRILFHGPLAYGWMTNTNTGALFNGERPIDKIVKGGVESLLKVRQHLFALGGGCFDGDMAEKFETRTSATGSPGMAHKG